MLVGRNKKRVTNKDTKTRELRKFARDVIFAASVLLFLATLSGCNGVRRRLTITSEPSGAIVYLNNKEIGKTPISHNFLYSGVYSIKCSKEGYETKETYYKAGCPWYLYPGIDFFSENFTPGELRDEQSCHITLDQKREIPENELYEKASKLRDEAHEDAVSSYAGSSFSQ